MSDMSFLDSHYFIDFYVHNCPFCRRRNVAYEVVDHTHFFWSQEKRCDAFIAQCSSCGMRSIHLTFDVPHIRSQAEYKHTGFQVEKGDVIDDHFFFSQPGSVFTLDSRIPAILRELLSEADGCLKSNYLTGASAATRKVVYEIARLEKSDGDNYDDRIKSLKNKLPHVDATYFDTLLTIQQVTSDKVHEDAYDGWEAKHLRVILAALREAVNEIYVVPKIKEEKRKGILKIKEEVLGGKRAQEAVAPPKPRPDGK